MSDFIAALKQRVLIGDGAMGTMLHAAGHSLDRALPALNLTNASLVSAVHEGYIAAGADIIQTNTWGASRLRLAIAGHPDMVREINLAGARIARRAAATADRPVFLAGSISPAVTMGQRSRVRSEERVEAVREQVEALVGGGVDLLILETFGHLDELVEAVNVTSTVCDLPIVAQATFTSDGQTLGGDSAQDVADALKELPVAVIGSNCTLGPQGMLSVVQALGQHTTLPLSVQPNAGVPNGSVDNRSFRYKVDGEYLGRYVQRYLKAGAVLLGGCCGTTPDHIRAVAGKVAELLLSSRVEGPSRVRTVTSVARTPSQAAALGPAREGGLAERLAEGGFVVAVEITPPLGGVADQALDIVMDLLPRGVDVFFIAPVRSPRAQMSPMSLALRLQQHVGMETVTTVTTWDKSIMTLQADMLGAHALGIRSIVCETGSPLILGDYPSVDGIWETDSIDLIKLLSGLNQGRDCNGLQLETKTEFLIGARCNSGAQDLTREIARARDKVNAGAQFLVARPVYELDSLSQMASAISGDGVPILLSVAPLRSFDEVEYLRHEVPDVRIPDSMLEMMRRSGDRAAEIGFELAEKLLREARRIVGGVVLAVPEDGVTSLDRLLGAASPRGDGPGRG